MSALGIMLVIAGAALMVAEAHLPSHGVLAAGAAVSLTAGVVLVLGNAGIGTVGVAAVAFAVALGSLALAWLLVVKSFGTLRMAARSGPGTLVGRVATVRAVPAPLGQVQLDGALWRARMWDVDAVGPPVTEGSLVVVDSIDGLTLTVRPAEEWEAN